MKVIIALLSTLVAIPSALAADAYQIIPLYSTASSREVDHYALLLNVTNGEIYNCAGGLQVQPTPKLAQLHCIKSAVKEGSLPAGPGVATFSSHDPSIGPAGLWKVDQTSGDVTLCASPYQPIEWYCKLAHPTN